jgi:CotH kinase protein
MFAKMGLPAPRETHVRFYVNNEYAGAYVAVEAIDRTFVARVYGANEANVETGGYLFEYQYLFPYYFEYLGRDLAPYAQLFKPQTRDTDSIVNIYGPIEDMIRAINESPDDQFVEAVEKYMDLRQAMTYLATETFMGEGDGLDGFAGMNNFYLYRSRAGGRSQFIPKDKDAAFTLPTGSVTLRLVSNVLLRRAMTVPDLRRAYIDALTKCAALAGEPGANDARGWLEREVERQTRQLTPAIAEDPVFPYAMSEFHDMTASLMEFARVRPAFVGCEVSVMIDAPDQEPDCQALGVAADASRERIVLGRISPKR